MYIEPNSERYFDMKDLPNEIWKPIEGYDNDYQISNYGRVKGGIINRHTKSRILQITGAFRGEVKFKRNKEDIRRPVEYLVAQAFMDYNGTDTIKHKDGDPYNNSVDNLEFI